MCDVSIPCVRCEDLGVYCVSGHKIVTAGIDGGGRLCILNSQCHDHDSNLGHITTAEPSKKLPAANEDNINITFPNMIEGDLATRI